MNIIIPLGGKGERFSRNGYKEPKPLVPIFEKKMINYLLDNLNIINDTKVFIIYNDKLDDYDFSNFIKEKYSYINLINVCDTKGAVETLYLGINHILQSNNYYNKCLILDCDTFYTENIIDIFNKSNNNIVFYTNNTDLNPIYSYIDLDENNIIKNIKEKIKISDNANTGAYGFMDIIVLNEYCKYVLDNNITFNNEPYTSCVISEMIKNNIIFSGHELMNKYVFSLGTPTDVEKYINNTHAFLFDLDGTLVITDNIYFNVWREILNKYNIILDENIYKKYIQGNSDKYVLETLLTNNYSNILQSHISELKDSLFIDNIDKIKVIDGVYSTLNEIKSLGHKISIVTNCNKNVAYKILNYIGIYKYIDFVISSNDCLNSKPHSEPYETIIKKYNINNNMCIIFEDSKSGILSGKQVTPKALIGIETIYDNSELLKYGVDLSIKTYNDINIEDLIYNQNDNTINKLKELIIKNNSVQDIKDIDLNYYKLKGGFIADVVSYKVITYDDNQYSQIIKYESNNKNNLSNMANQLELYKREYYFYDKISRNIKQHINIPKFYSLLKDNKGNNIGIILENLFEKNYKINLNLNNNIDTSLKIINKMVKLHTLYWNKNLKIEYPELKFSTDKSFRPFFTEFINTHYHLFKQKWFKLLNQEQISICEKIYNNFEKIQEYFSNTNNLTFIHGDIKSPNIFYDIDNNNEPYFIDWQHCCIGKGVQDLVFFIIESFDIINIRNIFNLSKNYYYVKCIEYGISNYSYDEYEKDIYYAFCYIPFFTSIWFGTIPQDELIDKNFPYFFINKYFYLINYIENFTEKSYF